MQYSNNTNNKIVPFVHLLNHYVAAAVAIAAYQRFSFLVASFRSICFYVTPFKDGSMQWTVHI